MSAIFHFVIFILLHVIQQYVSLCTPARARHITSTPAHLPHVIMSDLRECSHGTRPSLADMTPSFLEIPPALWWSLGYWLMGVPAGTDKERTLSCDVVTISHLLLQWLLSSSWRNSSGANRSLPDKTRTRRRGRDFFAESHQLQDGHCGERRQLLLAKFFKVPVLV